MTITKETFGNKSLTKLVKETNIKTLEFNKSDVSGNSILVIHSDNCISSFTYYDDVEQRDRDFETIQNFLN